ncbi:hypothetical protein ACSSS7_000359 [Eimeria intestinalis]
MASLLILGGTTGARQEQEEEEDTEGAREPTVGSPGPLRLGGTGDGDSEGHLTRLPSARPSVPAASSVTARQDCRHAPASPSLQMESLSLRAAAEQMRPEGLTSGTPATFAGVADRLGNKLSPERPLSAERAADLFRLWLSGTERLAALLGPVQAVEQILLTSRLQTLSRNPRLWSPSGRVTPRLLPLPPPHLSQPRALGLDALANGFASSTGNSGGDGTGDSSSVEVSEAAQPAAKRHCPPR